MLNTFVLFGGLPGGPELIVILLIIVLLFGAQKLPKLARSTGEAMGEFQKGREEVEQELEEMRENEDGEQVPAESVAADEGTGAATTETDAEVDSVIGEAETDTGTEQN
ncbi:twin-arginine translocase TatA/TatE family subunit [Haloglomus irregulare]|jgi:sec-independent protein translocase protein TatA|uniref:Sec-independent protein translocase protein TatA n=1 Tax=Haloglomus irregulare TaxID=2234134 RepID=A0A554MWH6_9EURY|nr:twin-arginine translocase TatA/TatE family subunit [Haloglomus irregulare]TSD09471.1 twin-arginine translocase TatA/TatE family subunit [Haloglomus irregulare]